MNQNRVTATTAFSGPSLADEAAGLRHVFVRDMVVPAHIGVYQHEHGRTQKVRINIDLAVLEGSRGHEDQLEHVVSYEEIVKAVRRMVSNEHINLVETLAERIAEACLADYRVRRARIRAEKLEVFEETESVGVEIDRKSPYADPPAGYTGHIA